MSVETEKGDWRYSQQMNENVKEHLGIQVYIKILFVWGIFGHKTVIGYILFSCPSTEIRHTLQLQSSKPSGIE